MKILWTCEEAAHDLGLSMRHFLRCAKKAGIHPKRYGTRLIYRFGKKDLDLMRLLALTTR